LFDGLWNGMVRAKGGCTCSEARVVPGRTSLLNVFVSASAHFGWLVTAFPAGGVRNYGTYAIL
jgi:hypothetical protein